MCGCGPVRPDCGSYGRRRGTWEAAGHHPAYPHQWLGNAAVLLDVLEDVPRTIKDVAFKTRIDPAE